MGLPNFIDKFKNSSKSEEEYFLALLIVEKEVKSAIWVVEEGKTKVMALGSREIWDEGEEDLTVAIDKSLATASERFTGEGKEPNKVVFGLAEDWTEDNKILPEYQKILSHVCEKLELKPAGFVSVFDALVHHLKDVEGSPASAIFINPQKEFVWVALVEVGKILGIQKVNRSENIAADVYEGLKRFSEVDRFPSRMLLFNGEELEGLRQVLVSYSWQNSNAGETGLPFLHLPKVEILPQDFDITSVAIAGGSEVARSLGLEVFSQETTMKEAGSQEKVSEPTEIKDEEVTEIEEKEEISGGVQPGIGEDLGFLEDQDVKEEKVQPLNEETAEKFNSEVSEETPPFIPEIKSETIGRKKISFPKIKFSLPTFSLPGPRFNKRIIFFILLLLVVLGGGGILTLWYFPKASITLYVTPKLLDKNVDITIDPNQEATDINNSVIPGKMTEISEQGEKTIATTGQKTVGDKAKGEITIYNRTDSAKTFTQGAIVIGPGNLKFSLDRDVTVASKTPDLGSGVDKWGESTVAVTAYDIGAQYNLAQKSQFTIKDYPISFYLAKNSSAFIGGTSRQISAVSDKDIDNLLKSLTTELVDKGSSELETKSDVGSQVVKESITSSQTEANFDHKSGDEGQNLNLKLNIKVKALTYKTDDFNSLAQTVLSSSVPGGLELRKEDTDSIFQLKKKNDDGSIVFNVKITASLLPVIDKEGLSKIITGKTTSQAINYFQTNVPGFNNAGIVINPSFLSRFQLIPKNSKNIVIEIKKS